MRRSRSSSNAPWLLAELGTASAETIARRMMLVGTGRCTHAEYRKMVPYHRAARKNARRLRNRP